MARSRFAPRRPPVWRKPVAPSAAEADARRASLAQFLQANSRRLASAPTQEVHAMQGQSLFDRTHTVIFQRGGAAQRMTREAARELVDRAPLIWSFDPWRSAERDPAGAVDIPHDWKSLPIEAQRALMTRLRLPEGSRGEACNSNSVTVHECLTQRSQARWHAAMAAR